MLGSLALSGCLGSSTPPAEPDDPEPPITGDIIRFNHLGLSDVAVEALWVGDAGIWVGGDQGVFFSAHLDAMNAAQANWQHQLEDLHIVEITGFHGDDIYAIGIESPEKPSVLLRSVDQGGTWDRVEHNFGGTDDVDWSNLQVLFADNDTGYLYGAGQQAIAVSYDHGRQWELVAGDWGTMASSAALAKHPFHNDLWLGGQNAIEESTLVRHSLSQQSSTYWTGLFPAPSVNQAVAFDAVNPDRILVGAEGGIIGTDNYGSDWQYLLEDEDYSFFFDLIQSPIEPDVWYSARWRKGVEPHQLEFVYSTNQGVDWQTRTHPATDENFGVRSMALVANDETGDVIWAGLQSGAWSGGGVMRISADLEHFHQ